MKNIFSILILLLFILIIDSCKSETCGECWATVDSVIEESTKTGEVCNDDYELKKLEEQDVINYMETIYPGSVVKYQCEDK